jgi:AcrR family transcriptional regulator
MMTGEVMSNSEIQTSRADIRRNQVLTAATECFRNQGFHSTSMSQISKASGMSVGHIYHYFENKEAIIEAIVENDLLKILNIPDRIEQNRAGGDIFDALVADVENSAADTFYDPDAPLLLEVVAEAARNPKIATIIRRAEATAMESIKNYFRKGLVQRQVNISEEALDTACNLLASIFEGFTIRLIRNPDLSLKSTIPMLRRTIGYILEHELCAS